MPVSCDCHSFDRRLFRLTSGSSGAPPGHGPGLCPSQGANRAAVKPPVSAARPERQKRTRLRTSRGENPSVLRQRRLPDMTSRADADWDWRHPPVPFRANRTAHHGDCTGAWLLVKSLKTLLRGNRACRATVAKIPSKSTANPWKQQDSQSPSWTLGRRFYIGNSPDSMCCGNATARGPIGDGRAGRKIGPTKV